MLVTWPSMPGLLGGADVILIPELVPMLDPPIVNQICEEIAEMRRRGRKFALLVVAEGVKGEGGQKVHIGEFLATAVANRSCALCNTGEVDYCEMDQVETRATVTGPISSAAAHQPLLTVCWRRPLVARR